MSARNPAPAIDEQCSARQHRLVSARTASWWRRLLEALDDHAPMPPDQRAERDRRAPDDFAERQARFKLRMLEKRGKGGSR
jgi:hypothetical protein